MSSGKQPKSWSRVARRIRVPLGFAFALLYLWLAKTTPTTLAIGAIVIATGLAIRALASGQVSKNEALATSGAYSYTRNPLYLGSILIGIGFAVAARNLWIWVFLAALFLLIYVPVITSEEMFLRAKFPDFESYANRVPRILPRWSGESVTTNFSRDLYLQHREYNALIGAASMLLAITVKMVVAADLTPRMR